jgi:hypothetical protein
LKQEKTMRKQNKGYVLAGIAALCLLAVALSGCGGGGGGDGLVATTDTVNGTVTNGGASTAGDVVEFDDLAGVKATIGNGGGYTLTVPDADITGSDNLWVLDNSGNVLDVVPIVLSASGGQTATPSTALPVAPAPPGNCFATAHC